MTTEGQTASESGHGFSPPLLERKWRLPIAYGSIATAALGIDLALILASATFADTIYH
jgi:hypothetical protein